MYIYTFCRAELSSEDDLSPDSDSDTMDVDSTTHEPAPSAPSSSSTAVGGSRGDKRQQPQQTAGGPLSINGKAGTIAGALVPDTAPQFAVSH